MNVTKATMGEDMHPSGTGRWLSLNDVCRLTSLSRTTINAWRLEGRFPLPIEVGGSRIVFLESEVLEWMAEQTSNRSPADRIGAKSRDKTARAAA